MGKLLGLLLVGCTAAFAFLGWWLPDRVMRATLLVLAMLLWVTSCALLVTILGYEAADAGASVLHCADRTTASFDDSEGVEHASSRWTWVPPGIVCEYPTGDVGATYWRIPAVLVLAATPIASAIAWPRRRMATPVRALVETPIA